MELRNKAFKEGLTCREIRGSSALPVGTDPADGPWLEYALPIESEELVAMSMEKNREGHWAGSADIADEFLNTLPDSVVRVICRDGAVAVLWNEQGEKADVALISHFLRKLSESIKWL